MNKMNSVIQCFVILLVAVAPSFAAELGYERFDYSAGAIAGQSGGSGWSAPWYLPSGADQGTADVVVPGLSFSNYAVSGGALKLVEDNAGGTRYIGARRLVNFDVSVGDDLWVSFLAKSDGVLSLFTSRTAEFRHGATEGATKLRMRPKGGGSQGVYIAYDSTANNSAAKSAQDDRTYLYICRFGDVGEATGKYAVMWVFDETAYNSAMADGILTEDDLNAYFYLMAQDEHANQILSSGDGAYVNLADSSTEENFTYYFDELRYGTSLGDVIPNPFIAGAPVPGWGQTNVSPIVTLSWTAGSGVLPNGHRVYFGTDRDAVANATPENPLGVYKGSFSVTSYDPGTLNTSTRYFWRVDQVTSTGVNTGYVWDFWTLTDILVDNFESYADTTALKGKWTDYVENNSGATVELSTTVYHQGAKSMRYLYESQYGQSISTRVFATPQDWSYGGLLRVMDVWFRGTAANTTQESLFIRIKDAANAVATVTYPTSADLAVETWTAWRINMDQFAGVDLANVKEVTLGFTAGTSQGSGYVYFDDIAIYPCRAGALKADLNGDCTVDIADLSVLAGEWLRTQLY